MSRIIKADELPPLTEEQIQAEIERAKSMPLTYDEDCPALSIEQLRKGAEAYKRRKQQQNIM